MIFKANESNEKQLLEKLALMFKAHTANES